ncbi:TrkA C-terminal domain-containing protein, partial [Candidatus Woesearchaeota archaeon]|nr:TrkA C-terminal domain-containing protein [Candidatus Woesearchaeota archaeon]
LLSIVADEPYVVEWVTEATTSKRGITLAEYDISKDSPYAGKTIGQIRKEIAGKAKILGVETSAGFERIPSDNVLVEPGAKVIAIVKSSKKE